MDADPVETEGNENNDHYLPPPGLASPVPGWTQTKVIMALHNNPTQLKGICSNYDEPGNPQWQDYDYKFQGGSTVFEDPTQYDGVTQAPLFSYDWGGRTTVAVSANWSTPEGDYPLFPIIPFAGADQVPRDKDADTIPDAYEQQFATLNYENADTDGDFIQDGFEDDDPDPNGSSSSYGANTPGDGFSVFDEYRGFVTLGLSNVVVYGRLRPDSKDVFIRDLNNLGIGSFGEAGELERERHRLPMALQQLSLQEIAQEMTVAPALGRRLLARLVQLCQSRGEAELLQRPARFGFVGDAHAASALSARAA